MNVNFEPIIRGLKTIFLTETKCKILFIYVGVNCKRKKWGEKMAKTILNFHFDYLIPSLSEGRGILGENVDFKII